MGGWTGEGERIGEGEERGGAGVAAGLTDVGGGRGGRRGGEC